MIKVIIELELVFPYSLSMGVLAEFCYLWDSTLLSGGTKRLKAIISMPSKHFKKIFGENPKKDIYPIPTGMEHFVENIRVKEILTK